MSELDQMMQMLDRARLNVEARTASNNKQADEDPLHDLANNTVTKSHALSRAYYRFGIVEKRCMEALISKLHPLRSDNDIQHIELLATEYLKAFPDVGKHAYEHLVNAADALLNRVIIIPEGQEKYRKVTLTAEAIYEKSQGKVTVAFNPLIVPHLIGLREKFSSYPLKKAVDFSSSYTWRFYEILVSWAQPKSKTGGAFMGWIDRQPVDELREMLGVPKSYNWSMFQKKVIEVVQTELKEKSNIFINFDRVKTGRKITHLNIKFIEDDQMPMKLKGGRKKQKKAT